jgi:predicted DNA-binding protein
VSKGRPVGDRIKITLSLDAELWRKLKYLSVDERRTVNEIVVEAIREKLEKIGRL